MMARRLVPSVSAADRRTWQLAWRMVIELVAGDFGFAEVSHETADQARNALGQLVGLIELSLSDVGLVECTIELIFDFTGGAFGMGEKLNELAVASALKSLGDIRTDGDCRAADLVNQREIGGKRLGLGKSIDGLSQLARRLPRLNVLKPLNFGHGRPSAEPIQNSNCDWWLRHPKPKTQNPKPD